MDTLLEVGLANALLAAGLGLAVALVTRVWRRPALAHALWLLVLLKLITPPLVPLRLGWLSPAEGEQLPQAPSAIPEEVLVPAHSAPAPPEEKAADPQSPDPAPPAHPPRPALGWKPVVLTVWLAGSAGWWLVAALRLARLRRLLRRVA